MGQNHIGNIPAGIMKTQDPARSNDVDFFPGAEIRWGLGYMLTTQPGPKWPERRHGGLGWRSSTPITGSTRSKRVTGLIMTQILPFADQRVFTALRAV